MESCPSELDGSSEWRSVADALIAFDNADRVDAKDLYAALKRAEGEFEKLKARGALAGPEAELFAGELHRLTVRYEPEMPPPEGATCYAPRTGPVPDEDAAARVADRIALLEQLTQNQVFHPSVLCRILLPLEEDLVTAETLRAKTAEQLRFFNPENPQGGCETEIHAADCARIETLDRGAVLAKELRLRLNALAGTKRPGT